MLDISIEFPAGEIDAEVATMIEFDPFIVDLCVRSGAICILRSGMVEDLVEDDVCV